MARFSREFLDELRARVPVSQVVGATVKLHRAGKEYKGLSPFQQEKTPSFFVNDQKGFWFDFSSGQNGTAIDFVMKTTGCSFVEAVERLARDAGMALPKVSPEEQERHEQRAGLRELHELAAAWFSKQLRDTNGVGEAAGRARAYLTDRGVTGEASALFRLGYAPPDPGLLKTYLTKQGAGIEDLVDAGLVVEGADGTYRDRFRDRLMIPITDLQGRVVAFGGRALGAGQQPKYLNSPETAIYRKGEVLFNAARARPAAYATRRLIVVEGYFDALAVHAAGHPGVVATCGTAITEAQLAEMWRWTDEPVVCLDGDDAGGRAAVKLAEAALPQVGPGKSLRFYELPDGDPDEVVRRDGAPAITTWIEKAEPLVDFLFRRETAGLEIDSPEVAAGLEQRMRDLVGKVVDRDVRRHYGEHIKKALVGFFKGRPVDGYQAPGQRSRFGRVPWSEQDAPASQEYRWVVKGVIPHGQTVAMSGPTQSGKSFLAFDLALHIARGEDYRGHRVRRGLVVYCAAEGGAGIRDRMRAFRRARDYPLNDVPIEALTSRFNLFATDADTKALIAEVTAIRDEWEARDVPMQLLIIDTLSAVSSGWNELQSADVSTVRARICAIEAACGCGVLFVHHLNAAGTRTRGHSSIIADIETEIQVGFVYPAPNAAEPSKDDNNRSLRRAKLMKQREGETGAAWDFVLRAVEVRRDADGDPVTSCVVDMPARSAEGAYDPAPRPAPGTPRKRVDGFNLNGAEVILFRAMLTALQKAGFPPPRDLTSVPLGQNVVLYSDVSEEYRRLSPMEQDDDEKRWLGRLKARIAYNRDKLVSFGIIGIDQMEGGRHVLWPTGKRVVGKGLVWPPPARDDDEAPPPEPPF